MELKCDDFDELIYLFWDGRIDEGKKAELEKHLSTCQRCKEKLALLESIEKGARGIKIKEPSQKYWDSFSSRVRERIVAQGEESFSFKLKSLLQNVFTFSPLKVRIAAGVISVALVFIVGKLYVDYRGEEIVPTKPSMESTKTPDLRAPEVAKDIAPPEEKAKKREKRTLTPDELEKSVPAEITEEGKVIPYAPLEQEIEKKKELALAGKELDKAQAARGIPKVETLPETIELKEEVSLPEAQVTRVGAEGKGKVLERVVTPEHKARDADEIQLKGITKMPAGEPAQLAFDRAVKTPDSVTNYFTVDDERIPKMTEDDTLLQEDVLRKTIETWTAYIEQNPGDSLANEGCLQVAIAYHLLSRLTKDQSDLSEGIKLLEKYEKQVTDPRTKEELSQKLQELRALEEK